MSLTEQIITIAICVAGTMLTRFLPFIVFSSKSEPPKLVTELGQKLPLAVFGMLVVYCVKDVSFIDSDLHGLPEIFGIAVTVIIQIIRRNFMLSVFVGTFSYMLVVNIL